jgi:hypothetical protein
VYSVALVVFYPMFYFRMTIHPVMATTIAMIRRSGFRERAFVATLFVSLVMAFFTWQFITTTGLLEDYLNLIPAMLPAIRSRDALPLVDE